MGQFFANDLHDGFGTWPLAYIRYGRLDAGEMLAVAKRVDEGDDSAFHAAWTAMVDTLAAQAEAALAKHRPIAAREFLLKAEHGIAISGWSLGGHLAPRAASGEHRLAACIADPAEWSITGSIRGFAIELGAVSDAVSNLAELDQEVLDRKEQVIMNTPKLHWGVIQRGDWGSRCQQPARLPPRRRAVHHGPARRTDNLSNAADRAGE